MKLSVRWLFDHLSCEYENTNISALIDELGQKVVEIEEVHTLSYAPHLFCIAKVESVHEEFINLYQQDIDQIIRLSSRANVEIDQYYLVKRIDNTWQWTSLKDAGSSKEGLFPAVHSDFNKNVLLDDIILTISNTAITHRPDLWSHRGFARELSVILGCSLVSEEHFLGSFEHIKNSSYRLVINEPDVCSAFGIVDMEVANSASYAPMALCLAGVDIKPISFLVDSANYCMIDWGQPLHIYDGDLLTSDILRLSMAQENEHLVLLDGTSLKTSKSMLMMYNDITPISLAGVMGGIASSVSITSRHIVLEGACFDAHTIRKSAQEAHIRTDASTRFEKELDQHLVKQGLERFIKVVRSYVPSLELKNTFVYQKPQQERLLVIKHSDIERLVGTQLTSSFIYATLNALGLSLTTDDDIYTIKVPSWRLKDISSLADIAEEVGRIYGWNNIETALACLALAPRKVSNQTKIMHLKKIWAYMYQAHEVLNYPVYNKELFSLFDWYPAEQCSLKNPVSEAAKILVNSLIPAMVHNCIKNIHSPYKRLSFFEINAVWHGTVESNSWAIIDQDPTKVFDFVYHKEALCSALLSLGYTARFQACLEAPFVWYDAQYCAQIMVNNVCIGYAGKLAHQWAQHLTSEVFVAEINLTTLFKSNERQFLFKEPSKFQSSWLDVSMMLNDQHTIDQLSNDIAALDDRITDVLIKDVFVKKDWVNQRSVTFRLIINSYQEQLTKASLEDIQSRVQQYSAQQGIVIR